MASYTAQSREAGRAPLEMGSRTDNWWVSPLLFLLVFGAFIVYTTYRMFENAFYQITPEMAGFGGADYLSPYYSPLLPFRLHVTIPGLGEKLLSPAIYILVFPLGFRMSCYYYRKAYYRAVFRDPMGCAVPEPNAKARIRYSGERALPFLAQNFHRFALYAAIVFIFILSWDAVKAMTFVDAAGARHFGMGVGTLVFIANAVLLAGYTFGCHSWRHLVGGAVDCYSCSALTRTRYGLWQKVSYLNRKHAEWAWVSMIWVGVTDLYVNLVARGVIMDLRIF